MNEPPAVALSAPRFFLTASEAYPALEQLFLEAQHEISAGFRVFDPDTPLRSSAALAVGATWSDLVEHTLARGVSLRLILSDFDPIARPGLHRLTWRSVAKFERAASASGAPERLTLLPTLHPARVGRVARLLLWPRILREVRAEAARLNAMPRAEAEDDLNHSPGLRRYLTGKVPHMRPKLWPVPTLSPATHHQKLAVFDRRRLYIGGLDVSERRYDTPAHHRTGQDTWHDAQVLLDGAIAGEAHQHLEEVIAVTEGRATPSPMSHLLRTLSKPSAQSRAQLAPKPVLIDHEAAHIDWIGRAERLIYLETQFFRSTPLVDALVAAARRTPELTVLLVVPGAPEDVAFEGSKSADARYGEYQQAQCLERLSEAFGARATIISPAQPRFAGDEGRATLNGAPLVYLHAKVSIFDDAAAIISSANLNGRSLRWDTEAGACVTDQCVEGSIRHRCFEHWLAGDVCPSALELATAASTWKRIAERNATRPAVDRAGFLMPHPIGPAKRFGRNLPGVPEEMV